MKIYNIIFLILFVDLFVNGCTPQYTRENNIIPNVIVEGTIQMVTGSTQEYHPGIRFSLKNCWWITPIRKVIQSIQLKGDGLRINPPHNYARVYGTLYLESEEYLLVDSVKYSYNAP
jgi:hypothetical protein